MITLDIRSGTKKIDVRNKIPIMIYARSSIIAFIQKNCKTQDIFLFGHSLGTGPSIHLAAKEEFARLGGLILDASFVSILHAAKHLYPRFQNFLQGRKSIFDNYSKIPLVQCKILYIHGKKDSLTPLKDLLLLYKSNTKNSQLLTHEGGHQNCLHFYIPKNKNEEVFIVIKNFCNSYRK